jgi:hypothetical protein
MTRRSNLVLSSHDINVLSSIVQQTGLPRDYLIKYVNESGVSREALKVAMIIINGTQNASATRSEPKESKQAALDFIEWANSLTSLVAR